MVDPADRSETGATTNIRVAHESQPAQAGASLRILIADDHEMIRLAIQVALAGLAEHIEWHEASCADDVAALLARDANFDLALLDFSMPGASSVDWIASLRARHPSLPLIVVSGAEDPRLVRDLIALGVAGFIPKSDTATVITRAVRLVLDGGTYAPLRLLSKDSDGAGGPGRSASSPAGLSRRQLEVLNCLARGLPNKLIARELALSEGTVKAHLLAIYRALDVRNRTEAVVAAQHWLRDTSR
jgi:DNA-binding NarL/FixJ family response regulator